MTAQALWCSRPIFISSTFRDMHAERDYLREQVFPRLEERLRERRHHLETIDLRWGVETVSAADQEAKELLVLKVCLAEVERSRPFLIVLLGDRYGWIPPEERMAAAAREAGFVGDVAGKSVTALEIEFGVLGRPEQQRRSFFYFREPFPYADMGDAADDYRETDRDAAQRLHDLKERIEREHPDRVRRYHAEWDTEKGEVTGLEALGALVYDDLWNELDAETQAFLQQPAPTWQEQERRGLDEFVEHRARGFLGREETVAGLLAFAESPAEQDAPWGLCVIGEAGAGKSAVFAHLVRKLQERDVLLLSHAAGTSPRSTHVDDLLRRWVQELADVLGIEDPLAKAETAPDEARALRSLTDEGDKPKPEEVFRSLLSRAANERRVVLLLDALNQFERTTQAQYLTWLPKLFHPNARLIATTIPGAESEALADRPGAQSRSLPALSADEAGHIAAAVCRRYHRELNPDVLNLLVAKQLPDGRLSAGNPLWLELALEELNLLDADDFARADREYEGTPEERLHQMLQGVAAGFPPTVEALYGQMLDRLEDAYGVGWTRGFANLIAVSRQGWRESDLRVLLPQAARLAAPSEPEEAWNDLRFASLRRGFRAHLVERGAERQWDFFHAQMRAAVEERNLSDPAQTQLLHLRIADHLHGLPEADLIRQNELMFHLIHADDKGRAATVYARETQLDGATKALAEHILTGEGEQPNPGLAWVVSLLHSPAAPQEAAGRLAVRYRSHLLASIARRAVLATRKDFLVPTRELLERLATHDPGSADWQRELSACHGLLGEVFEAEGDTAGALEAHRNSLTIAHRLMAQSPRRAEWRRDFAVCQSSVGDLLLERGDAGGALSAYTVALAALREVTDEFSADDDWKRDIAACQGRAGNALREQGDTQAALSAYRQALTLVEPIALSRPDDPQWQRDASECRDLVAEMMLLHGDTAGSLAAHRTSLTTRQDVASRHPTILDYQRDVITGHQRVAEAAEASGDLDTVLSEYRFALAIAERLGLHDPENAQWQRDLAVCRGQVGDAFLAQGNTEQALSLLRVSEEALHRLRDKDRMNVNWQANLATCQAKIGGVLLQSGQADLALAAYRSARDVWEHLVEDDPTHPGWHRDLAMAQSRTGDALSTLGEPTGALSAQRSALAAVQELSDRQPTNLVCRSDVALFHAKIGRLLELREDYDGALSEHRASLAVLRALCDLDPMRAEWQRQLSSAHVHIGSWLSLQGHAAEALSAYRSALEVRRQMAERQGASVDARRDLAQSYTLVAEALRQMGDTAGVFEALDESLTIREELAQEHPANQGLQSDLATGYDYKARLLLSLYAVEQATEVQQLSLGIRKQLAERRPEYLPWQRDLAESYFRGADILLERGDLPGALAGCRDCLAIRQELVKLCPSSAEWQQDLLMSHRKIGDVLTAQEDLVEGLAAYQESLALAEGLRAEAPTTGEWQRHVAVNQLRVGDVLMRQRKEGAALSAYQAALHIQQSLAAQGLTNTEFQRDLAVSHSKVADVLSLQWQAADTPIAQLWGVDRALAQQKLTAALTAYRASLAIMKSLAEKHPTNANWQDDLAISYFKLAGLHNAAGQSREEGECLERCHKVLKGMRAANMHLHPPRLHLLTQLDEMFGE
jgi:tetratricopeptide (TPR) repeat protein